MDTTRFIKKDKSNILTVQIYLDDIVFGATNENLYKNLFKMMQGELEMSLIEELTFFLGLQVKMLKDSIFVN